MSKLVFFTFGAGVQVPSTLLNDLQAEAINRPVRMLGARGRITVGGGTFNAGGTYTSSAPADELTFDLDIKPGVRIIAARANVGHPAGPTVTMTLYKTTAGVRGAPIAIAVSAGAGQQDIAITGQTEDTAEVGANLGEGYQIGFVSTAGGVVVSTLEIDTAVTP